jgi:hypothetical protein
MAGLVQHSSIICFSKPQHNFDHFPAYFDLVLCARFWFFIFPPQRDTTQTPLALPLAADAGDQDARELHPSSPWTWPSVRAAAIVLIPLALTALPLLVIPISGSFSSPSSRVNFVIYTFAWEPLYFVIATCVAHSFFLYSAPRLPWAWVYVVPSLVAYSGTVMYCIVRGSSGLDQDSSIGYFSILWTLVPVASFELAAAYYLQYHAPGDAPVSIESSRVATRDLLSESSAELPSIIITPDTSIALSDMTMAVEQSAEVPSSVPTLTVRNRAQQYLLSLASTVNLTFTFVFTQYLLANFSKSSESQQTSTFILFQVSTFVFRSIASTLAKYQTEFACNISQRIIALHCFSQHCFFFVFYRSLFTQIVSIGEFALFQVIHVVLELVQYVVYLEKNVFCALAGLSGRCLHSMKNFFRSCCCCTLVPEREIMDQLRELSPDKLRMQWHQTVELQSADFVARLAAMTSTWICFFVVHLSVTYLPYASPHFRKLQDGVVPDSILHQAYFLAAIVCEWAVAAAIDWFLRSRRQLGESVWAIWGSLVCSSDVLILLALSAAHITHDVYFPLLCMDFAGLTPACSK